MTANVTIDGSGNLTGTIDIPAGSLIGTKKIEIEGDMGTKAVGYISDGVAIDPDDRRFLRASFDSIFAPHAQTFYVPESRYFAQIKVYFVNRDPVNQEPVVLQVRKVAEGRPTQEVLAESRVEYANLSSGAWIDFDFDPVYMLEDTEYAFVLHTNAPNHTVGIARLGGIDVSGDAVTKQSYQRGVRLSSSNGSAWTAHQNDDLMFQIMGCDFTSTSVEIDLGDTNSLTGITDMAILAGYELASRDTNIQFKITDPDSVEYILDRDQVLTFTSAKTGVFNLKAILTGTSLLSPVLFTDTQILAGVVDLSSDYVSKVITAPADFNLTLKVETLLNGSSPNFQVFIVEDNGGGGTQETELTLEPNTQTTVDGWEYRIYKATNLSAFNSGSIDGYRIKLVSSGNITSRVYARGLVSVVSDAS